MEYFNKRNRGGGKWEKILRNRSKFCKKNNLEKIDFEVRLKSDFLFYFLSSFIFIIKNRFIYNIIDCFVYRVKNIK